MSGAERSALDRYYDAGLQPERTLLSWRRTCLALAVVSAALARYAGEALGFTLAVTLGAGGVIGAGWAYVRATARYRRVHARLVREDTLAGDGLALAVAAGSLLLVGIGAASYVVGVGISRL